MELRFAQLSDVKLRNCAKGGTEKRTIHMKWRLFKLSSANAKANVLRLRMRGTTAVYRARLFHSARITDDLVVTRRVKGMTAVGVRLLIVVRPMTADVSSLPCLKNQWLKH